MAACGIIAGIASCCSMTTPRAYREYMRYYVGTKVVAITQAQYSLNRENSGGGTGFHVRAPSGKVYIMTNRHVCEDADKDGKMWVTIDGVTSDRQLKVLEKSKTADLCLMEAIPGIPGLTVGDQPHVNDEVSYIGHPRLQARTFVTGELVGSQWLHVNRGEIGDEISEADCKASSDSYIEQTPEIYQILHRFKRNSISDVAETDNKLEKFFDTSKKVPVCYEKDRAYVTTLNVYGGASGSPMVNTEGEVVGVMYSGGQGEWGYAVTLSEVNKLLKGK